ncbi:15-hydroxyprostaglandin dehydrogenase [NAD(+)] [Nasonia vitripennis]|uniref:15-hydroxyprostaglandin dehydrogenase [NAD(+)] n=1 Tax=Nasonia vitripennis TaxID=7425 RepID=A0A7M7H8T2_NASVI|nr:15-hydroxyprostaglandin dehydrogenase [NAD(+)] [Nasonia vitripennis]
MDINDKVAIVTGGIKGIGFVTVQHLLRHGAHYVAIFDLLVAESDVVRTAFKTLEQEFDKVRFGYYHCNVVNHEEFIAQYNDVTQSIRNVDILVNNAGICNDNDPDLTIAVNITAVIKCTMYAVERMGTHRLGKGGIVVNIGSIFGLTNIPTIPVYNATKHAVVSFVRSLKEHNENLGMRIVCLCPGMTKTSMTTDYNPRAILLDFIPRNVINDNLELYLQDPNNVAAAIVEIVKRGKGGDVWLVQNGESPFNTKDVTKVKELRTEF